MAIGRGARMARPYRSWGWGYLRFLGWGIFLGLLGFHCFLSSLSSVRKVLALFRVLVPRVKTRVR